MVIVVVVVEGVIVNGACRGGRGAEVVVVGGAGVVVEVPRAVVEGETAAEADGDEASEVEEEVGRRVRFPGRSSMFHLARGFS